VIRGVRRTQAEGVGEHRQTWADVVRVAAVLMIFLYHFFPDWLDSSGAPTEAAHIFISDHFAFWAIAAFVILSSFSLSLGLLNTRQSYRDYLPRRLVRILAPFWTVAIPFALAGFALGEEPWRDAWKLVVWLLGLNFVHPDTYQPISEAWWYVSLALRISLVMPLLVAARRRLGIVPLTVAALAVNAAALALVEQAGPRWDYLAQGLVVCRLSELMLGLAAAELALRRRRGEAGIEHAWPPLVAMLLTMGVSPFLSMLSAWTSWQAIMVLAVLFFVGSYLASTVTVRVRVLAAAAALSYSFYLTHAPVSKYTGRVLASAGLGSTAIALVVALVACVIVAWIFDEVSTRWVAPPLAAFFARLLSRRSPASRRIRP
jgi:peptidoglycan/LPS O-acetylase OafA/YrhL